MKIHYWILLLSVIFTALAFQQDYTLYGRLDDARDPGADELEEGGTRFFISGPDGRFLEDVELALRSQSGAELMRATADGLLTIGLPDGHYVVEARDASGATQSRHFRVDRRRIQDIKLVIPGED
ncbi:hypothetical protein ACXYTJ_04280 [Gilvimarinus sp. F26214L]|uniref:hypothetical protein n=1 Tax=Gilvimarinus sp. DZF01 TaxID=3461371 RepID=UPI004045A892